MKNFVLALIFFSCGVTTAHAQTSSLHGQASGWIIFNPDISPISQTGLRYIPELNMKQRLHGNTNAELDVSLNAYTAGSFANNQRTNYDGNIKPYRAWLSLASNEFELRAGLQRISFGSATLFRPLMWFDRIDPRDPLQITDGVYGLLARYYFLNNANVWLWGLYGNNEPKGWEIVPTAKKSIEYGGRMQTPLGDGEMGFSYHHRDADISIFHVNENSVPENRFALDGKWDFGIGAWFEATLIHQQIQIPGFEYQRQWTLGADYTFPDVIGERSLTVLTEFFRSENPTAAFSSANGHSFSGLYLSCPLGLLDQLSTMLYRDWTNSEWYRIVTWQRTYDNWIFYLLGFWNPNQIQLYHAQGGNNTFAGKGIQIMAVFNH